MKPTVCDVEIYRCSIVFLCETTKEEWLKFYKSHKTQITESDNRAVLEEYEEESPGFCIATDGNDYLCMISDRNKMGLVAHEIFHAADMILSDRNYKFNGIDEPVAYLIEYLTNKFYDHEK